MSDPLKANIDIKNYETIERLPDGRDIHIRAIRDTDKEYLVDGFQRLSKESIHSRFFGGKHFLSEAELVYYTEVDFVSHVALVAEFLEDKTPLGVGRFFVSKDEEIRTADVAVTVEESYHGLGIGSALLSNLMSIARKLDVREFKADVMASNTTIFKILKRSTLKVQMKDKGDFINIRVPIQ